MNKTIEHIEYPAVWHSGNDWFSHRPLLYAIANNPSVKLILEVGVGHGSTPLLKSFKDKTLISVDTDKEWAGKFDGTHIIDKWENLATVLQEIGIDISPGGIDLMFVDCKPGEERKNVVQSFSKISNILIAHDTEDSSNYVYDMKGVLSGFKYRIDFSPHGLPRTTAVSNFIDITEWVSQD